MYIYESRVYHIPAARWADARAENIRSVYGRSERLDHTFDYAFSCLHFVYKSFTESSIFFLATVVEYNCFRTEARAAAGTPPQMGEPRRAAGTLKNPDIESSDCTN